MSAAREGLTERILSVSSPFRCTKKADTYLGICFQTVEKVQLSWAFSVFYDIMIWVM